MKRFLRKLWKFREKKARDAREVTNYMGADVTVYESIDPNVTSEFVGYEHLTWGIRRDCFLQRKRRLRTHLSEGEHGTVFCSGDPRFMRQAEVRRRIQDISVLQKVNLK